MEAKILEGVIIGTTGGSLAGITVYLIQYLHKMLLNCIESNIIHKWIQENTSEDTFRSTRTIASWTNLPIDRAQYLCSHDKRIKLSTGENEDMWALRKKLSEPTFE